MIVAGLQMDLAWENPEENHRRAAAMTGRAVRAGARLVALPEMFNTGFTMSAEPAAAHAGETRRFLADLAKEHGVHLLGGYAEPGAERPANACSIFDPGGREILHYRKIHPFSLAKEHRHYEGGAELPTVEVEGVRVTPLICYDLRFPEPFRIAAERTDLFVVIANWPVKRSDAWSTLLRARAMENQAFVLGVNRVGVGSGEPHSGDSALHGPMGETVAAAKPDEPGVIFGSVGADGVRRARRKFGFLSDRRPEVYRTLE